MVLLKGSALTDLYEKILTLALMAVTFLTAALLNISKRVS